MYCRTSVSQSVTSGSDPAVLEHVLHVSRRFTYDVGMIYDVLNGFCVEGGGRGAGGGMGRLFAWFSAFSPRFSYSS